MMYSHIFPRKFNNEQCKKDRLKCCQLFATFVGTVVARSDIGTDIAAALIIIEAILVNDVDITQIELYMINTAKFG